MMGLGFGELLVIFLIALIFIGPKKLPELAKGLGKGIREFQNAAKGLTDQLQDTGETKPKEESQGPAHIADASHHSEEKYPLEGTTHEQEPEIQPEEKKPDHHS